jgi:hypothetical protein
MQDESPRPNEVAQESVSRGEAEERAERETRYPFDLDEAPPPLGSEARATAERLESALDSSVRRVEPNILRPLAALAELEALCRSLEYGRPAPRADDRRSLAADLQLALTSLGDQVRSRLQPGYRDVVTDVVPRLPELLDDPGGRLHIAGLTRELRRRLVSEDAVVALWRDLRASVSAGVVDEEIHVAGSRLSKLWRRAGTSGDGYVCR